MDAADWPRERERERRSYIAMHTYINWYDMRGKELGRGINWWKWKAYFVAAINQSLTKIQVVAIVKTGYTTYIML